MDALLIWIFVVLLPWIYHALFESSRLQATPGKMALGMIVTNLNQDRISFGTATLRYFGKLLSLATGIGFILAAFTPKKQALHDLIATTTVLDR